MALEAGLGGLVGIDDRAVGAAGVDVGRAGPWHASQPVSPTVGSANARASVGSRGEMVGDICVALHARLRTLESGTRDHAAATRTVRLTETQEISSRPHAAMPPKSNVPLGIRLMNVMGVVLAVTVIWGPPDTSASFYN